MRKVLFVFVVLMSAVVPSAFAVIISDTYYFNENNTGLTGGPWGSIQLSQDTSNPYRVSVRVDPFEQAFNVPDLSSFGISRFLLNLQGGVGSGSQLVIEGLAGDWSWGYLQDGVSGNVFGAFDFKLRENALGTYLENPLVFDIAAANNAFTIGIENFTALSTEGYLFGGVMSGFLVNTSNGPVTSGWFAANDVAAVPEPGTFILIGIGLAGTAVFGKRASRG